MNHDFKRETITNNLIANAGNGKVKNAQAIDVDNLVTILDSFADSNVGRLKLQVSDEAESGSIEKKYHHGRCDVNSPWACGDHFDVIE